MPGGVLSSTAKAAQSVKLSPTLKQLLASQNPDPHEGPTAFALTQALTATLYDAKERIQVAAARSSRDVVGPDHEGILRTCLTIMTATFLTKNVPSTMGPLYRFATTVRPEAESLSLAEPVSLKLRAERTAVMREAGLKCTVLVGIPRTINTLGALREVTEDDVKAELDKSLGGRPYFTWPEQASEEELQKRGGDLFDMIYTPHTSKLLEKLGKSHPDFPGQFQNTLFPSQSLFAQYKPGTTGFIVQHAYGGSLSNRTLPDSSPLISRTLVSALAIACLRSQGRVGPQLTSHVFGLLKSAKEGEARAVHERWLSSEAGAEWVIQAVDRLCEVVASSPPTITRL
ncbi:hypothetical protein FRB96_002238 [Tulasnella sp. 330]|nr:hypothetical protein FRB96_002238 [Tulasnella sp. 330]KAG8875548.1 hypothetical protein FRB97_005017 [Tulasnella sp. 331]